MSFAYFNQGGKEGQRTRAWARNRFNELVGKDQRCAASGCQERKARGLKFCVECLQALPEGLRDEYLRLQREAGGGPRWQDVYAGCINELAMRTKGGLS